MSLSATADEAAIRDVYAALFAALEAKDSMAAQRLFTHDFESVDPHGIQSVGLAEFAETLAILMAESTLTATRHSIRIVALAGDEAEVEMESEGTVLSDDGTPPQHIRGRSNDCLRRDGDGQWRLSRSISEYVGPPD